MAGAFTHLIISNIAKTKRSLLGVELWQLFNKHYRFLFLGSASPDLPYLSFKTGSINWADVMHYEKTNSIVDSGFTRLKTSWQTKTVSEEIKLVWLMGYVSHLVADATIHPVVESIVGPYEKNKTEHRICEMTQDSLIFNAKMKTEIRYSEFSATVKFCRESEYFDELMEFWRGLTIECYQEKGEVPNPSLWFTTYGEAIDTAEGGSELVALFRHIGLGTNYIYRTKEEIGKEYPQDIKKYYKEVNIPGGQIGTFQKDAFEKAVNNVVDAWKKLYDGVITELIVTDIIRNWNLDTGIDMDSPDRRITYWA